MTPNPINSNAPRCTSIRLDLDHADQISSALVGKIERACEHAEDAAGHTLLAYHLCGGAGCRDGGAPAVSDMTLIGKWERALRQLEQLKVPTIAVLQGYCAGPLLEVLLTADYRVASPDARIGFAGNDGTIWPGMNLYRLATQIGVARARRFMLFGADLDIKQALEIGVIDRIEEDPAIGVNDLSRELASPAFNDVPVRRRLLLEASFNSYEDALGSHLAACDRALRYSAAERETQGALQRA